MKDKIKEILECLEKYGQLTPDAIDDLHYIRDYITNLQDTLKDREEYCYGLETQLTNLQEENERLKEPLVSNEIKELITLLNKEHLSKKDKEKIERYVNRLQNYDEYTTKRIVELDYKIEKAIEYIKEASYETLNNGRIFYNELPAQELLNILQGEDKDDNR